MAVLGDDRAEEAQGLGRRQPIEAVVRPIEIARRRSGRYFGYAGRGRATARPSKYGFDRGGFTLEDRFYRAIATVAHPAADAMAQRLRAQPIPVADPLYLARDEHVKRHRHRSIVHQSD